MGWNFAAELTRYGPAARPQFCWPPVPGGTCPSLTRARSYCARVTRTHYENFTVVSALLPRRLVPHFHAVYAYCRWSDDLADETAGGDVALELIAWWRRELLTCYHGNPRHPVMVALQPTIHQFGIPADPFLNLLTAFEQDQRQKEFATFADLLAYCQNSANPVGHLVLYLFECFNLNRGVLSDEVCTGLQLANFWQDVARDADIGRCYIPREDRERFGYTDADWQARRFTPEFARLMEFQVERTQGYFQRGKALLPLLPPAVRIDVDLFISGGEAILLAVRAVGYNVWAVRPEVTKRQKVGLLLQALLSTVRPSLGRYGLALFRG